MVRSRLQIWREAVDGGMGESLSRASKARQGACEVGSAGFDSCIRALQEFDPKHETTLQPRPSYKKITVKSRKALF